MRAREKKDKDLRYYELAEYFRSKAMETNPSIGCDMILHNLAEQCPPQHLEYMDSWLCAKLITLLESSLEALQSVPIDRATPFQVRAALSHIGQNLTDINDPKLKEMKELFDGPKN